MLNIPYTSRYQIGLDLSEQEGHAVLLGKKSQHYCCQPIATPHFNATHPSAYFKNLRAATARKTQRLVIGLASHDVMQQHIALETELNDSEIQQYLTESLENLFHEPAHHLYFDWEKFHSDLGQGSLSLRVMAVKRERLAPIIHACKESHFQLRAIEIDAHANARLVTATGWVGILTIHPSHANLLVLQRQNIIHLANIPLPTHNMPLLSALQELLHQFDAQHPHCLLNQLFLCSHNPPEAAQTLAAQISAASGINTLTLDCALILPNPIAANHITACGLALRGMQS